MYHSVPIYKDLLCFNIESKHSLNSGQMGMSTGTRERGAPIIKMVNDRDLIAHENYLASRSL